jgi:putative aminopeptidase FrvX
MNLALLKDICQTPGAPGFENKIRKLIISEIDNLVDSYHIDGIGNLIAFRKGKTDKKLMVTAHMDEISFIITHIDEEGFLRIHPLGGFDPKTLTAQRVIIHGKKDLIGVMGSKPVHLMKPEERTKAPQMSDYYIDLGMEKDEVLKYVSVGDPVTREREFIEMGDCINSKSLDNRVSVFTLIEVLKLLKGKELPCNLYMVFTVQEEVGLRGAGPAAHAVEPDFGINVDVTVAFDTPGALPFEVCTRLGKGTAIKIADGTIICDSRMVNFMKYTAVKHGITWQPEILVAGGTDTAMLQRAGKGGAICGAISIPTRHIHSVIEMVNKNDLELSIKLLEKSILDLLDHEWAHH